MRQAQRCGRQEDGGRRTYRRPVAQRWTLRAATLLLVLAVLDSPVQAFAQSRIYVPTLLVVTAPVGGSGEEPAECELNAHEEAILAAFILHPDQKRKNIQCDPILAKVARERAEDMAARNYFSHTNPDGKGPNFLVRAAGYRLPSWYPSAENANNIESIAAGYATPAAAWAGWMNSGGHRTHLLGTHSFYAAQTQVGVGYAFLPGSRYGHYWVVLSAPPQDSMAAVQELPAE